MALEIVRRIRGNVHGTIDVSVLENTVLAHPFLQRLRRIKQLAFLHYVFPGATHTRFEHSLGVMQMASIAWEKMRVNQQRLRDKSQAVRDFVKKEKQAATLGTISPTFQIMDQLFASDYHLQVLRLAGLLHDIGHPPFSHSGERFLPTWQMVFDENREDLPEYLSLYFENVIASGIGNESVRHEIFSVLLADKILRDTLVENPDLKLTIEPRDVVSVILPAIPPSPNSPLLANGSYILLHELVSGELDIDRMDYLIRDSKECGVVYGIFDAGRILDSLCIYQDLEDHGFHVGIMKAGLAAFEDYLKARHSMYLQVYFHKTSNSAEAMISRLRRLMGSWNLPAKIADYARVDEYNIGHHLSEVAKINDFYDQHEFKSTLENLLYNRKLWKTVLELTGEESNQDMHRRVENVRAALSDAQIPFEQVSSKNSLTRFQPRDSNHKNFLRILDKQEVPQVTEIADISRVYADPSRIMIHRIYVSGEDKEILLKAKKIVEKTP